MACKARGVDKEEEEEEEEEDSFLLLSASLTATLLHSPSCPSE
jgi:hypothetical protein